MSHALQDHEQWIVETIKAEYSSEEICAFLLSKTIQNLYRATDAEVMEWYEAVLDLPCNVLKNARNDLVKKYTRTLMSEYDYEDLLNFTIKDQGVELCTQMVDFFDI